MESIVKKSAACVVTAALALCLFGCGSTSQPSSEAPAATPTKQSPLSKDNPTTITIWNYYNGDQQAAFDQLVNDFNSSVGSEQGIVVETISQGSINNLSSALLDSAEGKVGAQDLPTMAAVYAETAFDLDKDGLLVDLDDYFTADELSAYIEGFIDEGRFVDGSSLKLFPVSKSTECFAVNTTDWAPFQAATGITPESITDYQTLASAAEAYYNYTDGLTPDVADDGKALYGRDSVANYMVVGSKQLGHEFFTTSADGVTVDTDRATAKTLWENYYVPFVNGYYTAQASHRSEDVKTGTVLCMTGSTSGVSYLPTSVTDENDATHDIVLSINNPLGFKGGQDLAVQQGAGYCVFKSTEQQQYAAAEFLKWFTDSQRNLKFSVESGYSPVTIEANNASSIEQTFNSQENSNGKTTMLDALLVSSDVYLNKETYTSKPFEGSAAARDILADAMEKAAVNDRAAVVEAIQNGSSRADAVASYTSDEAFETWYNGLVSQINTVSGK